MKIALVENFGSDFFGARLRYAQFLKDNGHHVVAVVPDDGYADKIVGAGIETISIKVNIRSRDVKTMFAYGSKLGEIFKKEKFDIIHFYRMQPNIIGSPIAYFASRKSKIINHITGLGVAFTKSSFKYNVIRFIIKSAYNLNSRIFNAQLILQNNEDKIELGNLQEFLVVKGSAVNEDRFRLGLPKNIELIDELKNTYGMTEGITLIFVSRLLKQKGLSYLVEAVRVHNLNHINNKVNLLIAGWLDFNNPDSFTKEDIEKFSDVDGVIFLGKRNDIDQLINISDIAVLPTYYREGTPRFLLEAMAIGKPILTTDMPGCNHLVKDNENGILVQPMDQSALTAAIEILSKRDLNNLGSVSRKIYENEFSENVVYNKLLETYLKK
ncbi:MULTISPECIES: glycosyltransferase family 4 protein [Sphingobacterium]|uniref:glycosyltransferase family 4 protein n=1 Tax=Sphingobacterium TaxID=28453 RepID=UPI00104FB261|nr:MULTISPECIES: glycosyltransferase family 4 protein [Sphingobacterium]MCW2262043.1 glycosyltransferase involved in cell wall biosynthesis [Sphingobacterium kitahiroshimense]TCR13209.1 glycosyltransferase involved in cell wall biosynthesis [Sphingobacterium sp. JUb78]